MGSANDDVEALLVMSFVLMPRPEVVPPMQSYSTNAKGNFQFDRVIGGWRDRPVLDFSLKR